MMSPGCQRLIEFNSTSAKDSSVFYPRYFSFKIFRFSDLSELQISREIFSSQITTSLNDDVLFPFHNMQYLKCQTLLAMPPYEILN